MCDFGHSHPVLNHLFDVTQTIGQQLPSLWSLESIDQNELAGRLTFYDTPHLSEAITSMSREAAMSAMDEFI